MHLCLKTSKTLVFCANDCVFVTEMANATLTVEERAAKVAEWPFAFRHNIRAYLDKTSKKHKEFEGMIEFLKRSRIFFAISEPCTIYLDHQRDFWTNATYSYVDDKLTIKSQVHGHESPLMKKTSELFWRLVIMKTTQSIMDGMCRLHVL